MLISPHPELIDSGKEPIPMPRLTEQEIQDVIRYLEADKPLPDKYRFLLFDEKREKEMRREEICPQISADRRNK